MKRCIKCILPETFPGIKFDEDGICNFCLEAKDLDYQKDKKMEYKRKFESLIQELRGKGSYDTLMGYSGGKDSTYTLTILKEKYDLNILAITMDNGFISEYAIKNIKMVVDNLEIDHILFRPRFDILKKIFCITAKKNIYSPKVIERASAICTSCISIVKFSILRMALEKNVPLVTYGWTPGQAPIRSSIMKTNPQIIKSMQKIAYEPMYNLVGGKK